MDDSTTPVPDIPAGPQKSAPPESAPHVPQESALPEQDYSLDISGVEFSTFYQAEFPRLVRYLMKQGAHFEEAAEAAQEASALLYKEWRKVRKPAAWLRTVAFRVYINRSKERVLGDEEENVQIDSMTVTEVAEFSDQEQRVLSAIRKLSPSQRKVFALHYDNFTCTEIAGILQMKEPAVRQNLARARAALKELLGLN